MNIQVHLNKKKKPNQFLELVKSTNHFYDRILRALFISLLFMLDLVMFIYSVNGRLFEHGVFNEAVLCIVGGFFAVSLVIMFLLSFSGVAQSAFCALFVFLGTIVFLNQFALFNVDTFIETWLQQHADFLSFIGFIPSSWLAGICLGLVVFSCFKYSLGIFLSVLAVGGALGLGIYQTESLSISKDEYSDVKKLSATASSNQKKNLVYIMAPKFPSYHFLSTVKDINFRELRDLMIGFYAVNNFEIYPNAFVQSEDTVSNVVDIYNQVDYISSASGIRGYAEILNDWNFVNGSLEEMALEDNKLYEDLNKQGYKISTYALPAFNLCYKGGTQISDRCVLKQNHIVSIYDKKSTLEKNIYALLGEWIQSFHSRDLKSVAKMFYDMSSMRGMKILSENRRLSIEGAPVLFNKLYDDFSGDNNGIAYMVLTEMPSDLFIYDEFCNLKPRKEWVALKDNSIYTGGIDEKRKAYVDQAKCFIGMVQMFMEKMYQNDKLTHTDIVVQGVSPLRELAGMTAGQYGNFVSNKLVSLGIRNSKAPNFVVNTEICLSSDITKSFVKGEKFCYTIDHMKMTTNEMKNLKKNLINNSIIRGSKISNIAADYVDWYEMFKQKTPYHAFERESVEEMSIPVATPEANVLISEQVEDVEPVAESETVVEKMPVSDAESAVESEQEPAAPIMENEAVNQSTTLEAHESIESQKEELSEEQSDAKLNADAPIVSTVSEEGVDLKSEENTPAALEQNSEKNEKKLPEIVNIEENPVN